VGSVAWASQRPSPGEHVVWQGAPDWRSLAVHAFHVRKIALYFVFMLALQALNLMKKFLVIALKNNFYFNSGILVQKPGATHVQSVSVASIVVIANLASMSTFASWIRFMCCYNGNVVEETLVERGLNNVN
jgi:hypothetical protein